jgi:hypothetical protein
MNKIARPFYLACFLCGCSIAAKAQIYLAQLQNGDPGKCYYMQLLQADSASTDSLYLELVPAVFKTEMVRLKDLKEYKNLQKGKDITIQTTEATTKYEYRMPNREQIREIGKSSILICLVEVPARFQTITTKDTLSLENIAITTVVKGSAIRWMNKATASSSKNEVVRVAKGKWSDFSEYIGSTVCGVSRIKEIQEALVRRGYQLDADGVLNAETKAALVDFQKKNHLPQGRLDIETMNLLEVQ